MTSFSIQTFGCRVNQAEAFLWAEELQRHGMKYEENFSRSDLVVVNSCTLTSKADSDVRSFIRRAFSLNPKVKMIVTGCFVERAADELKSFPRIWRVLSNAEKDSLTKEVLSLVSRPEKEAAARSFRSRAFLKVQDGCNFRCTFCIIPSVRGRSVSLKKSKALSLIREFVSQGFREIVLTGIHLCSYGRDLEPRSSFLRLLQDIECLDGAFKVRLSSLDPRYLETSLIEHLISSDKLCPHFHLSLQSGSDSILSQMGRKISVEEYKEILRRLRERSPQASLGADVIVGFPGETEADFIQTRKFLEQSPLTYFHVFSYSPRPGTVASSWKQVDGRLKKKRAFLLRELSKKKNFGFRLPFVDQECEAIVVKKGKARDEVLTSNYLKVFVPPSPFGKKEAVRVRVIEVSSRETKGQIVGRLTA